MSKENDKKITATAPPLAKSSKLPIVSQSEKPLHIPRNVNYYSHFLQHSYITEKDIEWVLKLRDTKSDNQDLQDRLSRIPNQPFAVADRKTTVSEQRHKVTDLPFTGNAASVMHLLRHRGNGLTQRGQLSFETGLRTYGGTDKGMHERERAWTNLARKDRNEFPEFLPNYQEEMKTKKEMQETGQKYKNTYSGFDGEQNFPNYTMKFKQKNVQDIKHLFGPGVKISTVQWQEGLRDLKPVVVKKDDQGNPIGKHRILKQVKK